MAQQNNTFLTNIDTERVEELLKQTSENVSYFNKTCEDVVKRYSESLDNLMSDLYVQCIKNDDATLDVLEKYYLD